MIMDKMYLLKVYSKISMTEWVNTTEIKPLIKFLNKKIMTDLMLINQVKKEKILINQIKIDLVLINKNNTRKLKLKQKLKLINNLILKLAKRNKNHQKLNQHQAIFWEELNFIHNLVTSSLLMDKESFMWPKCTKKMVKELK